LHPKLYFTLFAIIRHKNWQANENGDEQEAENFVKKYIFDKPKNFFNLEKNVSSSIQKSKNCSI
jgi:hypothetical protein